MFIKEHDFFDIEKMTLMVQRCFEEEVDEYLKLKGKPTRTTCSSGFRLFLRYYQTKHGKDKGFGDFLDRIFEELQKPRREQKRITWNRVG